MLVAPCPCPAPVAVAPAEVAVEALGEADELAEGVVEALLEEDAEDEVVAPEPWDAVEPEDADEPSPSVPCVVSVTVVVVVVAGVPAAPASRTGAPTNIPTTIETLKTAMIAAAIPIGLRYLRNRPARGAAVSGADSSGAMSRVSAVGSLGVHSSEVGAEPVPAPRAP